MNLSENQRPFEFSDRYSFRSLDKPKEQEYSCDLNRCGGNYMVVIMDEMSLYTTLKDIYFTLDNGDRRLLETFNLSVPRFYLLKHISENPGISLTSLSGLMLTDKSNITRLIQSVEAQDLVCKKQNETDRRSLSLYLTQNGQRLLDAALDAHRSYTEERFQPVHEHVNGLLHNLVAMKKILDSQLED